MSRRVSQSFTLSFAELKFILSIFCATLLFISEPLRENKNTFLVSPYKRTPAKSNKQLQFDRRRGSNNKDCYFLPVGYFNRLFFCQSA